MTTEAPITEVSVWVDDPPSLVLRDGYLRRLTDLGLSGVAVMLDGPEPGLGDQRWTARDLEHLADALPDLDRTLTVWTGARRTDTEELLVRLPELVDALGAIAVEADAEPVGGLRERLVKGYADEDDDGRKLDDALKHVADALLACGVDVEVTVFPGAYHTARHLVDALAKKAPQSVAVRLWLQLYAVRSRSEPVAWDGVLGPLRLPYESPRKIRQRVAPRVEVCNGFAVYDDRWPDGRSSILPSILAARRGGCSRHRAWSSKWLCRKAGWKRRADLVREVTSQIVVPAPPSAPPPADLVCILRTLAAEHKEHAPALMRCADEVAKVG